MKEKKKTPAKEKAKRVASLGLVAALIITGIFAFLTATDSKDNVFKLGSVNIQLYEAFDSDQSGVVKLSDNSDFSKPDYVYKNSSDEYIETSNGEIYTKDVPSVATEKVLPNQVIEKAPWIVNTGDNDAYIYMKVGIPVDTISTESLGSDGYFHSDNNGEAHEVEMFTLLKSDKTPGVNEGWTLIPHSDSTDYEVGEKDGQTYHYYVYGYTEGDGEDGIVEPDQVTEDLFSYVKFVNYDNEKLVGLCTPSEVIADISSDSPDYENFYGRYDKLYKLTDSNISLENGKILMDSPLGNTAGALIAIANILQISNFAESEHTDEQYAQFEESIEEPDSLLLSILEMSSLNSIGVPESEDTEKDLRAKRVFNDIFADDISKINNIILTPEEEEMYGISNEEFHAFLNRTSEYENLDSEKENIKNKSLLVVATKLGIGASLGKYTYEDLLAYTNERINYCKTHKVASFDELSALFNGPAATMLQLIVATQSTDCSIYGIFDAETGAYFVNVPDNMTLQPLAADNVRSFLDSVGLGFWYNVASAYFESHTVICSFEGYGSRITSQWPALYNKYYFAEEEAGKFEYDYDTESALIGNEDLSLCGPENIFGTDVFVREFACHVRDVGSTRYTLFEDGYSVFNASPNASVIPLSKGLYATEEGAAHNYAVFSYNSENIGLSDIAPSYDIPINAYGVQVNNRNYSSEKVPTTVTTKHRTVYLFDLPASIRQTYINYEKEDLDYAVSNGYIDSYEINELPNDDTYALYTEGVNYSYRGTNVVNPTTGTPVTEEQVADYTDEQMENLMLLTVSSKEPMYFIPDSTLASMNWTMEEETVPRNAISVIPSLKDLFSAEFETEEEMNEALSELLGFTPTAADDISLVYYGDITEGEVYCVFAAYVTGNHTWDLSVFGVNGSFEPGLTIFSPELMGARILEYDGPTEGLTQVEVPYKNYTDKWVKLPGTWGNISTKSEINEIIDIENNCWNTTPNNTPQEYYEETDVTFSADFVGGYNSYGSCKGYAQGVYIVNIVEGSVTTASGIVLDRPGLYINSTDGHCFAKRDTETSKTTYTYSSSTSDQTGSTVAETLANTWAYASGKCNW